MGGREESRRAAKGLSGGECAAKGVDEVRRLFDVQRGVERRTKFLEDREDGRSDGRRKKTTKSGERKPTFALKLSRRCWTTSKEPVYSSSVKSHHACLPGAR
jgi:hypothetical protein